MDIFEYNEMLDRQSPGGAAGPGARKSPLAYRMRPKTLDGFVGQEHILGEGMLLRRAIQADQLGAIILYGPPGTGKTTLAQIIAGSTRAHFRQLNAVTAGKKDIEKVIEDARMDRGLDGSKTILFIDEIHRFNKAQQDALLPAVEAGTVTLIGATTENPFFEVNKALLSRSRIFQLKALEKKDLLKLIDRAMKDQENGLGAMNARITEDAADFLAETAGGDARAALNALELGVLTTPRGADGTVTVDLQAAEQCIQKKALYYDKDGDSHYDLLSAFQKSIRGSDPDAAVHYLARLIAGGDLESICRRLLVIASEDIGLAYPNAITIVKSCVDAALQVGFPEASINLSQAVLVLATAPKSNSAVMAISQALSDVETRDVGSIPPHLRDSHYEGSKALGHGTDYKYPHAYPHHWVEQQYLPDALKDVRYYIPGDNRTERAAEEYMIKIKGDNHGRESDSV